MSRVAAALADDAEGDHDGGDEQNARHHRSDQQQQRLVVYVAEVVGVSAREGGVGAGGEVLAAAEALALLTAAEHRPGGRQLGAADRRKVRARRIRELRTYPAFDHHFVHGRVEL